LMNVSVGPQGHPVVYMYYRFVNSTYDSGWVLYDVITVPIQSYSPFFITGYVPNLSTNGAPIVTQWVVCGDGGGSSLSAYSWNATMALYYRYNARFYSVPSAVADQPGSFYAGITGETVDPYNGIEENYSDSNGLVYQFPGPLYEGFLWPVSANISSASGSITMALSPDNGLWVIQVSGVNLSYSKTFIATGPTVTLSVPAGEYNVVATLYAGANAVASFNQTVVVP
ncbi:MAG: thermopsin family protease, partial [Acidilobus sp.]